MFKYRSDIDGIRGIAILAVLFYHAEMGFPGGFVGVDIFFVISGYLITKIIFRELEAGTFSLINFWERRVRRIFPALFCVLICTFTLGFFLMLAKDFKALSLSIIWAVPFSSNIYFWRNTGDYFDGPVEEIPLLHTWSLSIEEQFYIIVPIIILITWKYLGSKNHYRYFVVIIILSLFLSIWGLNNYKIASFYLLPTRAWELAVGSLLAFASPQKNRFIRSIVSWLGLMCVFTPIFLYSSTTPFPGLAAMPPVFGTAMIIWSGIMNTDDKKSLIVHKSLSIRPLVWVGLISYSLYLWHWPLLAYYKYLFQLEKDIMPKIIIVLFSVIIATLSTKYIERPFRRKKSLGSRKSLLLVSFLLMVFIFSLASKFFIHDGVTLINKKQDLASLAKISERQSLRQQAGKSPLEMGRIGLNNQEPKVLFLGDSHCGVLVPMLDEKLKIDQISGRYISASSDPLLNGFKQRKGNVNFADQLLMRVKNDYSLSHLKEIVLISRWQLYVNNEINLFDNESFYKSLEETLIVLNRLNCNINIMVQVPEFSAEPSLHMRSSWPYHFNLQTLRWVGAYPEISELELHNKYLRQINFFNKVSKKFKNVRILDPLPLMLSNNRKYKMFEKGVPIYCDHNHLSVKGSNKIKSLFNFIKSAPRF